MTADARTPQPLWLLFLLYLCRAVSRIAARLHFVAIQLGLAKISPLVCATPGGVFRALQDIWFARWLKELIAGPLKTRLRSSLITLVQCTLPGGIGRGAILTTCYTPWARLIAEWCRVDRGCLVLAGGEWSARTGNLTVPGGLARLRHLVRHIRAGGLAIVIIDTSPRSRSSHQCFLGEQRTISLLPARLARIARVPLIPIVASFQNGVVCVRTVATPLEPRPRQSDDAILRELLVHHECQIQLCPAIWSFILKRQAAGSSHWLSDPVL
jgi:hypothetical protein